MEMRCSIRFVFCLSCAFFLQSCLAEEFPISATVGGNISVVLETLEVNLFVLKGDEITRHVNHILPNSPILRPPCRTCDPTYNLFHIDNQYLIPNHSKIYVVNPNSVTRTSEVDIGNCNPTQLYSVKQNVVWIQCAFEDNLFEVVELRREDNVNWYRYGSQNIRFSTNVSRNGLVLVKEKDGENVTFLYYGSGGILERKGLEEFSLGRYSKTSLLCKTIEELFYINGGQILIQCILKDAPTEHGLVLFNTSNPSQPLTLFHRFHIDLMKVHVFEEYIVLLSRDTLIVQNALRFIGIEQLIVFPPDLSINGIFVRLNDIIYFVCNSRMDIYFIDIASVLGGNVTAFHRIESGQEICIDVTCSPIQYIEPLLFVPLKTNELAMYTLDPVKLHATAKILTGHFRYFFTYTMLEVPLQPSAPIDNNTIIFGEEPLEQSKSNGLGAGVIAGITVAAVVIILCVVIVIGTWYWYHKRRSSRYYHYQASEVRFERADNNQGEGIVIVSGRLDNRVRLLNDSTSSDRSGEEQSNVMSLPTPGLNNQSATNAKKTKDTNTYITPCNVDYYPDDDNGSEMSYGFETRQEPVDRQQYVDSLVIGTFKHTII